MTRQPTPPPPHKAKLTTPRLRLVPITLRDAPAVQRSFPRWPIVRFMLRDTVPWPYPDDGAASFLSFMLAEMDTGARYCWGIHLKDRTRHWLIGTIELRVNDPKDHIGFWLAQSHWGNGYMREAACAVYRFAFEKLGMPKIRVMNATNNQASHNVQVASGARFIGRVTGACTEGPCYDEIWELTPELLAARPKKRSKK